MKKNDKQHICPECEGTNIKFGPVEIKFDRHTFSGKTYICKDCDNYLSSPKLEFQIEEWAKELGANFHQYQPVISKKIYQGLEELAGRHGVKPAVMAKILATIYLERSRTTVGYTELKKFIFNSQTFKKISGGEKYRISVPVKYEIYKEINEFTQVWELARETEVLVEAINFCITLVSFGDLLIEELQTEIKRLKELITLKETAPLFKEIIESDVRYIAKAA